MTAPRSAPPWAPGYRHRTVDLARVDFRFRVEPEDFCVEELFDLEPSGSGTHLWIEIEKRGLSTREAARRLAQVLDRRETDFGYAGRKDARAVTRQRLSIEHVEPERLASLELPGVRVLSVARHDTKLRIGQLRGNRFRLRLLGVAADARPRLEAGLAQLQAEGLPNYFGAQRFGRHGLAFELGRHLARGESLEYLLALASPQHGHSTPARAELARLLESGTRGERRRATQLASKLDVDLAAVARQLARRPKDPASALRAVPKATRRLHLSAFQSRVFNRVLALRLGGALGIDELLPGDVAYVHGSGAAFGVPLAAAAPPEAGSSVEPERTADGANGAGAAGPAGGADELRQRVAAFELSPSGPIPGRRMLQPLGPAAELEAAALSQEGVSPEHLEALGPGHDQGGARRPLRVPLARVSLTFEGEDAWLGFDLPKGSFATTVLEELRKDHRPDPAGHAEERGDPAPDPDPAGR